MDGMPDVDACFENVISLLTARLSNDSEALLMLLNSMSVDEMAYTLMCMTSCVSMQIADTAIQMGVEPLEHWRQTVMLMAEITE